MRLTRSFRRSLHRARRHGRTALHWTLMPLRAVLVLAIAIKLH
jgi:hypothetical protein